LKNCQVSPTEKIYVEPIYSQFTCLSVNLFRSEQFFKEQARDTVSVTVEVVVAGIVVVTGGCVVVIVVVSGMVVVDVEVSVVV
jgi:hypothetical protein